MADVIGILGITITVFDQLLKLGERTAVLVDDARAFGDDTRALHALIVDENNRNRVLRLLLFEESPIYGRRALFEKFDSDNQEDIKILLGRAVNGLSEGLNILVRRYSLIVPTSSDFWDLSDSTTSLSPSNSSISTASTAVTSQASAVKQGSPSPLVILRWTLRDKKRMETILHEFANLNSRIHEKIKLCCLASSLGLDLRHLMRLQEDSNSKLLGFNIDAALKLTAIQSEETTGISLELKDMFWDNVLKPITPLANQGLFATVVIDSRGYIHESYPYELHGDSDWENDRRPRGRVEGLARILHQPKEQVFRIPRCVGWRYLQHQKLISFVFESPEKTEPISLLQLLFKNGVKPSLGDKFRLALGLANSIAQLHMIRWVHESFRSENVLFFPRSESPENSRADSIRYSEPWILGFTFARPESFFSTGPTDFSPSRDIYRHPERQGDPQTPFVKGHDIYSLGVILLEIGLWEPAITLEKNMFNHAHDSYAVQAQLKKHAMKRLEPRMGSKYKNVVLKCLLGKFEVGDDTKEDLKLQLAFRTQVVDVLETAANSV